MAKQLNVELSFTANTAQAKQQIDELQRTLSKLSAGSSIQNKGLGITKDIQEGMQAASKLKTILNEATNTTTGKLDLTKFTQSLNASKMNLTQFRTQLEKLGPQGSEAFMQVARSISNADAPLMSINKRFGTLLTTLKNTAKWQISSSILHGFMGAVQGAYGYAQDLNESLNNIRIVTGQSTEQMAKFAQQANNSAKALSSTTTAYTDAALIYYQQGLNDEQVKERTDVTIKMANVSKDSAETVSEQMTAIWNNFDNGSKKLEYYADVMTALGAATASSSAEIATGVQQFASVAETAGMSYEYAASALATITATTRQSASTVGTGLRTVLARIESLNLGDTLDDGVTLTKYTKALEAIGVNVLDMNGNLRTADSILDDMAAKWQNLSEAQKMATAETVGGVRQYTTIMSLMENWDFMEENLAVARGSEGTLQEQADIYAESWEAAQKRVKAAAQQIYSDLINDKFFITILNGAEKILTFIDDLIDSLGGLPGILSVISTLVFKLFSPQIASGLTNAVNNLKSLTPAGQAQVAEQKNLAWEQAQQAAKSLAQSGQSNYGQQLSQNMQQEASIQQTLIANAEKMSDLERQTYQLRLDGLRALQEQNVENAKNLDILEQTISLESRRFTGNKKDIAQDIINTSRQAGVMSAIGESFSGGFDNNLNLNPIIKTVGQLKQEIDATQVSLEKFGINDKKLLIQLEGLKNKISSLDDEKLVLDIDDKVIKSKLEYIGERVDKLKRTYDYSAEEKMSNYINDPKTTEQSAQAMQRAAGAAYQAAEANANLERTSRTVDAVINQLNQDIVNSSGGMQNWANNLVSIAGNISGVAMGINSILGSINTFKEGIEEGNLSLSSMLSMVMSLTMGISMMIPSFTSLINNITSLSSVHNLLTASILGQNAAEEASMISKKAIQAVTKLNIAGINKENAAKIIEIALSEQDISLKGEQIASTLKLQGAEATETGQKIAETVAQTALNAATIQYLLLVGLVIAAVVAIGYAISTFIVSQKEAKEAMDESNQSYEDARNKLQELQGELDSTSEKIDELQSKGALNLVEQRELNQLKAREAALERQINLQKQLVEMEQASNARTIMKNFNSAYGNGQNSWNGAISQIQSKTLTKARYSTETDLGQAVLISDPDKWFEQVTKGVTDPKIIESYRKEVEDWKDELQDIAAEYAGDFADAEKEYLTVVDAIQAGVINKDDKAVQEYLQSGVDTLTEFRKIMAGSEEEYTKQYLDTALDSFDDANEKKTELYNKALEAQGQLQVDTLGKEIDEALLYAGIKVEDYVAYLNNLSQQMIAKKDEIKDNLYTDDESKNKEINNYLDNLTGEDLEFLLSVDVKNIKSLEDLIALLQKAREEAEATQAELDKQAIKDNYADNKKTADAIKGGQTNISADEYDKLSGLGQEYFQVLNDGTYELIGSAEAFYNTVQDKSKEIFDEDVINTQQQIEALNPNQSKTSLLMNGLEQAGAVDSTQIEKWNELLNSGSEIFAGEAFKQIQEAADNANISIESLNEAYNTLISTTLPEAQNQLAASCVSLNELSSALEEGKLTLADGSLNMDAYDTGLISLGNQHENAAQEVASLQAALESEKRALEANDEEQLKLARTQQNTARDTLNLSVRAGELSKKYNIAADEIEDYAKQLKESGKYEKVSGKELAEMAKDQLRYDKAVTSTTKNLSKWKSALQTAAKTGMLASDSANEMAEAYGNLLDMDPESFSPSFLKDEKNLQLLEDAINGVDGAYEELQQAAQDDLNVQLNLDGDEEFLNKINEIENRIANVPEGLDISAELHDEGFLNELTNLVNAAGMTAEQATSYLSSMGIDAEVKETPITTQETVGTELIGTPSPVSVSYNVPSFDTSGKGKVSVTNNTGTAEYPGVTYSTRPILGEKKESAISLEVTSANKSSGGNTKFSQSSPANSGGGGGGCFIAGTPVSMIYGYKLIEKIKIGDIVLSYNEQTKQNEYSKVVQTMIHLLYEPIYTLYIENEKLVVTGIHRFLITDNNSTYWIPASELQINDLVLFADGTLHQIYNITTETKAVVVYNFEVSGNHNYYVGYNQILAHNKGGGGGGNTKANPAKRTKTESIQVERYKEVTDSINDLSRSLSKANSESDKLWGENRLKNIDKENKLITEQIKKYDTRVKQAEKYRKIDQKNLQNAFTKQFYGQIQDNESGKITTQKYGIQDLMGKKLEFKFDADGSITNYTSVMKAIQKKQKEFLKDFDKNINPLTGKEFEDNDAKEDFKALYIDPLDEALDNLEEMRKQYEETIQQIKDDLDEIVELRNQKLENNYEKLQIKLEFKLEINEREMRKVERAISKLEDNFYKRAENVKNYEDKMQLLTDKLDNYKEAEEKLTKQYNAGKISQNDYIEGLKEIRDGIDDTIEEIDDLDKILQTYFQDTLSEGREEFDKSQESLAHITESIEHYRQIAELTGKSKNFTLIGKMLDVELKNSKSLYARSTQYYNMIQKRRDEIQKKMNEITNHDSFEYKTLEKELEATNQELNDAENEMLENAEKVAESYRAIWENTIESIKKEFEDWATQGQGFDLLSESMNRASSYQDMFLTKTNQVYEMTSLLRKLQEDADKTQNQTAKQRIALFSREMEQLKNKSTLSKLELDIAKARYQQMIAQIALEEAQNNKSQVRLRRDSEGNYGYMYTADQNKIAEAQDNLDKANNDLYNIVLNATNEKKQEALQLNQDYLSAIEDLERKHDEGMFENEKEYENARNELIQQFYDKRLALQEDYNLASQWLAQVGIEGTSEAWINEFDSLVGTADEFLNHMKQTAEEMGKATATAYKGYDSLTGDNNLKNIFSETGSGLEDLTNLNKELSKAVKDVIENIGTELSDTFKNIEGVLDSHQKKVEDIVETYEKLADATDDYIQISFEEQTKPQTMTKNDKASVAKSIVEGKGKWITNKEGKNVKFDNASEDQKATLWNLLDDIFDSTVTNDIREYIELGRNSKEYQKAPTITVSQARKKWEDNVKIPGLDTGGYTGVWGSDGKLAFLHEKEIVLNPEDTENMLASVGILRNITQMIDLRALSAGLASLSAASASSTSSTLQQEVTIHAEFPNATDHNEIEMAFDSLVNRATQYAGRF